MAARIACGSPEMSYPGRSDWREFYGDTLGAAEGDGATLLSHPKVLRSQPEKYSQRDWPLRLTQ